MVHGCSPCSLLSKALSRALTEMRPQSQGRCINHLQISSREAKTLGSCKKGLKTHSGQMYLEKTPMQRVSTVLFLIYHDLLWSLWSTMFLWSTMIYWMFRLIAEELWQRQTIDWAQISCMTVPTSVDCVLFCLVSPRKTFLSLELIQMGGHLLMKRRQMDAGACFSTLFGRTSW